MALYDKIHTGLNSLPTQPTRLVPYNFFNKALPISLEVDDIFRVDGNVPTMSDFSPKRVFYIDDIDSYLLFDVANPAMAAIYLIDAKTRETRTSYTYMVESCPTYKDYDHLTDVCVHHKATDGQINVSFMIVNDKTRSATIARYGISVDRIGEPTQEDGSQNFIINLSNLLFFADVVPPGAKDAIALPYTLKTVKQLSGSNAWQYPEFDIDSLAEYLKETFHVGSFNEQYCNITVDEAGRYICVIGSSITGYLGPHLTFPIDTQYIVVLDQGGMNHRFALLGPYANAFCWDEGEIHQPYKFNITAFDGRYLLALEERKSRYINPKREYVDGIETEPRGSSYVLSEMDWPGGAVADVYYPARQAIASYPDGSPTRDVGYPTSWDETSNITPVSREYIWTLIDMCDLFSGLEPEETRPQPPYQADIVFLVDTSGSMAPHIASIQNNMANFVNTLWALKVTDVRVGVMAYTSSQRICYDTSLGGSSMWATTDNGAQTMSKNLHVGLATGTQAWHNTAIEFATNMYKYRQLKSRTRYFVLISDTTAENDPRTQVTAIQSANSQDVKVCVVGNDAKYFESLFLQTGGTFYSLAGDWGRVVAFDLAGKIAADAGANEDHDDWWTHLSKKWVPEVLYKFTPVMDLKGNSFVTMYHDYMTYVAAGAIVRHKVNYLTVYDDYPTNGGRPQDSIYVPSLVPGEQMNHTVIIKNESHTGYMKKISLELLDKPDDITVSITGFPAVLNPQEVVLASLDITYNPSGGASTPVRHLDAKFKVTYWMQHVLNCSGARPVVPTQTASESELFFVEDTTPGLYTSGLKKQVAFDPLFTSKYSTSTSQIEHDVADSASWDNEKLYVIKRDILDGGQYIVHSPTTALALSQMSTTDYGFAFLKVTGPQIWETRREHELSINTKTWWIVNQSPIATFVAHVVLEESTLPDLANTGFLVIEYPEGNIVPPGQAKPVTFKWQPIFNPLGEEVTRDTTYHSAQTLQLNAPDSIWSTSPGMFKNAIFAIDTKPNFEFKHTFIEWVSGSEGRDIPNRLNQALDKYDPKLLVPYDVQTYFTVDTSVVAAQFPFVQPAGIWAGFVTSPTEYTEYRSPSGFLDDVPAYIDHKWSTNPAYLYNADTQHSFQLAPFNKKYAENYEATLFYGNFLVSTQDVANTRYIDMDTPDDAGAEIVACDSAGSEKVGWLLEDFWPVPGSRDDSIDQYATEDDYLFERTVYVKNRGLRTVPIILVHGPSTLHGISIQGVNIVGPTELAPDEVGELKVSFRVHYTYRESGYVNMIKETLYVPRFKTPLTVTP